MYNKVAIYKYRELNKDKVDIYMKQYYDEKKDNFKEYYDENKENKKEYARRNYEKTKENKIMKQKQKYEFKKEWNTLCKIGIF